MTATVIVSTPRVRMLATAIVPRTRIAIDLLLSLLSIFIPGVGYLSLKGMGI